MDVASGCGEQEAGVGGICSVTYGPLGIAQVQFDGRCNISKVSSYNNFEFIDIYLT